MIKHIVMWTLKEEAGGKTKAQNLETMKALLEELPSKVPGVVELEVAASGLFEAVPPTDIALYTVFKSKEDLKAYAVHPEHLKVVEFVKSVAAERRVIDYEA
uniref:Dabb family protein n=1 Tax=Fundidesulfovibrio putealis TaxID=270496 RepID=A0A7C4AGQ0_9BACT